MSFNALLHFRTESSHFAAMSGIFCIIELYCPYVHCSFRHFLDRGFFSFLSVIRGRKWVLLSSFLLHFTRVADDGDTVANISLPFFLPADVFLSTADADRSFSIRGIVFSAQQHICYSALYAIARPSVRLSVCLSVCPSVTRVDQSKTFEVKITQLSPQSLSLIHI